MPGRMTTMIRKSSRKALPYYPAAPTSEISLYSREILRLSRAVRSKSCRICNARVSSRIRIRPLNRSKLLNS
jgi:hypothetical protein